MRSGDLVCTTRCEVDDDDCEIWFGGKRRWHKKKEENLLNFSRFFNFQFFASFQSHFTAASLHPTRLVAANKKKSSSASSLCCHFPQVKREKKSEMFFLPSPILPLAYVCATLFSLPFLIHINSVRRRRGAMAR